MTRLPAVLLSFALTAAALAQTAAPAADPLQNLRFRNLGPAVAGGRVTTVAGVPDDPHIYYVGTAAGGVYKSDDSGQTCAGFQHAGQRRCGSLQPPGRGGRRWNALRRSTDRSEGSRSRRGRQVA